MLGDESDRLEALRLEANFDALTGLANRSHFLLQVERALRGEELPGCGLLALLRVADLAALNRRHGREPVDRLLADLGAALAALASELPDGRAGRLSGADFAVLSPGATDPAELAVRLLSLAHDEALARAFELRQLFSVGLAGYEKGMSREQLLALADAALAAAEAGMERPWCAAPAAVPAMGQWREPILEALQQERVGLGAFPVVAQDGRLLHLERPLRLRVGASADWLPAADVLPAAVRLGLAEALDLAALRHALDALDDDREHDFAINLAGQSIAMPGFRSEAARLLGAAPAKARRLWLEVSEHGALAYWDDFRAWCDAMRGTGCRLGIEHFGQQLGRLDRLQELGLDYLKVDAVLIEGLAAHAGNQAFLRGLCGAARTLGVQVIAEGVSTAAELEQVWALGFGGATGAAVTSACGQDPPSADAAGTA
jgi:EAL domain-containing protein (putative c-di-GMP-specific phosphodiesterase class I)/GGDEF domain-containing protein